MIDVILPTYNNLNELKACLDGFSKQTLPDFRILCCVDGSTDGTMEYLHNERFPFKLKTITHPDGKRHGRNPTRNLALGHLDSDFLILLDSDLVPDPDFVLNHLSFLRKKECISLGNVIYQNTKQDVLADYIQSRARTKFHAGDMLPVKFFNTQNVAMKTRFFIESGGQDASMTTYGGGDIEFGIRLEKMFGLPIFYHPAALAIGEVNKSLDQVLKQMEEFGAINLKVLRKKHPEYRDIYQVKRLESNRLGDRFIRLMLRPWIAKMIRRSVEQAPGSLRRKMIQYLMFYHLTLGYYDKKGETL